MRNPPIYVETTIHTSMDALWAHTQEPQLHEQWDLRFTSITYLTKQQPNDPQRFLYTTKLGFGIGVAGEGESIGTRAGAHGESTSSLKFWSDQPISLIREGSGYWKYIPTKDAAKSPAQPAIARSATGKTDIRFLTWYDYRTRFGWPGALFDRLLFRPIIGWATALSFDVLRIWLEEGTPAWVQWRRFWTQCALNLALALCWLWQGIVPKVLFPQTGEIALLQASPLPDGSEQVVLLVVALVQIALGIILLLPFRGKWPYWITLGAIGVMGVGALLSMPMLFAAPFSPASLSIAMAGLAIAAILNARGLPAARNCLRRERSLEKRRQR